MANLHKPFLAHGDRLVCFGDSLSIPAAGYIRRLIDGLAPLGVEVIPEGRPGDKTPWALTRLQQAVIDREPDAVSIFLGTNDCMIGRGRWSDEPCVSPEAYATNLRWMIHVCRQAGIAKFSITPPLWRFEGPVLEEFGDSLMPYCRAAREVAAEMDTWLVPADDAFAGEWARRPGHTGLLLTTDGVHLNRRGNELLAEAMLAAWGSRG